MSQLTTPHSDEPHGALESIADHLARRRSRRRPVVGVPLTAMIDIVFLLLLYFLLSIQPREREEIFAMQLDIDAEERAETPADPDPFALTDPPLVIVVESIGPGGSDCTVALQPFLSAAQGPPPRNLPELAAYLADQRVSPDGSRGLYRADQEVVIRASDGATRWEHMVGVFNAARRAGLANISFEEPTS